MYMPSQNLLYRLIGFGIVKIIDKGCHYLQLIPYGVLFLACNVDSVKALSDSH